MEEQAEQEQIMEQVLAVEAMVVVVGQICAGVLAVVAVEVIVGVEVALPLVLVEVEAPTMPVAANRTMGQIGLGMDK